MDKTYYENNLAYLFSNTDPVYKINPVFKQFTIETNTNNYEHFLKRITSIVINNQNPPNDKINHQEQINKYMSNLHNKGQTFPMTQSFLQQVPLGQIEIYVNINRGNVIDFKNIGELFTEFSIILDTSNHDEMYRFLREHNIEPVSKYNFSQIFKTQLINKLINSDCIKTPRPSTCDNLDYQHAIQQLAGSITDSEVEDIYKDLTKISAASIDEIINFTDFIPSNLITELGFHAEKSFMSSPFYYRLRAKITANSSKINEVFPMTRISTTTMMYIRKILADLYIKTAYLTIHFDILSSLQKKHQKLGDFMNARFGILAMTNFTYTYINGIYESVKTLPSGTNTMRHLKTRLDYMSNYITGMSNIESTNNNSKNKLAKIIKDVHVKSFNNYNKSLNISDLKEEIHKHQIALNNIMTNSEHIKRRHKYKYMEFVFITTLLFIIIIGCSILFLLKQSTWVMWIALNVMRLIIVFLIVKLLTFFIYKN
jgi:hypothetical protein